MSVSLTLSFDNKESVKDSFAFCMKWTNFHSLMVIGLLHGRTIMKTIVVSTKLCHGRLSKTLSTKFWPKENKNSAKISCKNKIPLEFQSHDHRLNFKWESLGNSKFFLSLGDFRHRIIFLTSREVQCCCKPLFCPSLDPSSLSELWGRIRTQASTLTT